MKTFFRNPRLGKLLLGLLLAMAGIAVFYALAKSGIGIPCLFYRLTGLQCPGCGNSRAVMALLRLDFISALQFNLMFLPEMFYLCWVLFFCCREYLRGNRFFYKSPAPWLDWCFLGAFLLWWPLRNII